MATSLSRRRTVRLSLAAAIALGPAPALAGDKPATPEGAMQLKSFFAGLLPAAAAGAPSFLTVTPEGVDYLITFDLSAVNSLIKATGSSYDPATIIYKLVEQDDGRWRVKSDSLPKIGFRTQEASGEIEIDNYQQSALIDPAIGYFLNGSASAAKGLLKISTPKLEETVDFGPVSANAATTVNDGDAVSTVAQEEIADIGIKAKGFDEKNAPVNISGRIETALINLGIEGFKSRKAYDLWSLVAAHPERADLAQHEAELKGLLKEVAAPGLKVVEGIEMRKTVITSAVGAVALGDVKYELGAASSGPQSSFNVRIAADGLSLPAGLAPPAMTDLVPSKIDVAATLKGIDITAAANEAIAVMSLKGDGPPISEADSARVSAAFLSAGPLRIEIAPSHIAAPAIDADFNGHVDYALDKVSGAVTIHMRGFEKAMAAVRNLGPDVQEKAIPVLAMAKGLAKTEGDGSLSWLVEIGQNRSIKVNGIPLGKAPE
ncbi:MAG TPA: hypothetical protein VKG91_06295 [Roseiarcus sp.]|nr:hypothetical protein [Roseiarcus sp.]